MEGSFYHINSVLISYCLPGKKYGHCYEETKKNTSERRNSRLNLHKGIQVKGSSSFFSSFVLAKNIFDLTGELKVVLESWDKSFQKIVVEYVFKNKDENIEEVEMAF